MKNRLRARVLLMAIVFIGGMVGAKKDGLSKDTSSVIGSVVEQEARAANAASRAEASKQYTVTEKRPKEFEFSAVPEYDGHAWFDVNDDVPFFSEEDMSFNGQEYWTLDELGRCTGVMALVGPETLPTEKRDPDLSSVTPTGWHQAQYEGIDPENGDWLFQRCHLAGYQLTGQNANEQNLITGTRYMNVEGMLPFENSVRQYVETGNHVVYRVTPYFEGDELLSRGVLMEARSVEDNLVQFCAFCYNVQPGIELDYATGESWREDKAEEPKALENADMTYILNTSSKKIHKPSCSSVSDMKDKNKKETTQSRDELISDGYTPCKRCNP